LGEEPALVSNKGLLAAALMAVHQVLGTARCRSLISSSPRSNCRAQIGADFLGRAMVEKHLIDMAWYCSSVSSGGAVSAWAKSGRHSAAAAATNGTKVLQGPPLGGLLLFWVRYAPEG